MHLTLAVVCLAFEDVAAEDLKEHCEPEKVQRAHRAQEHRCEEDERLELRELGWVYSLGEYEPDHLRQAVDAGDEPSDHAHDEGDGARILEHEAVETFGQATKDVRKVMQVGNHRAKRHHIAKNVTEIQRDRSNVMQQHLLEV